MLYVGLSRVRSINDIQVIGFRPSAVKADPDAIRFYQKEPAMHQQLINVDPPSVIKARVDARRAARSVPVAGAAGGAVVSTVAPATGVSRAVGNSRDSKKSDGKSVSANVPHPALTHHLRMREILKPIPVNENGKSNRNGNG